MNENIIISNCSILSDIDICSWRCCLIKICLLTLRKIILPVNKHICLAAFCSCKVESLKMMVILQICLTIIILMIFISSMRIAYAVCLYLKYKKNIFLEPVDTFQVHSRFTHGMVIREIPESGRQNDTRKYVKYKVFWASLFALRTSTTSSTAVLWLVCKREDARKCINRFYI